MNIQSEVDNYIESGGDAKKIQINGEWGVLFDEQTFIPWGNMGYNEDIGFYDVTQRPDLWDEAGVNYVPVKTEVAGGPKPEDDYTVWGLVDPEDSIHNVEFGEWKAVVKAFYSLGQLIKSGGHLAHGSQEVLVQITAAEGAKLADGKITYTGILKACEQGRIFGARRQGKTWFFPRYSFLTWLATKKYIRTKHNRKD